MCAAHRTLTSLNASQLQKIYRQTAFDVDAPVYIYAGKPSHGGSAFGTDLQAP